MTTEESAKKIDLYIELSEQGKHSESRKVLKDIYSDRHHLINSIDLERSNKLAKCLIQAIKMEIPQNEDEEIDTALISYYCSSNAIENSNNAELSIEALKNRVILLFLYGELLVDILVSIIYTKETYVEEALMHQRKLCEELIRKMQLVDIYNIDDLSEGNESDPVIDQICNNIETESCLSEEDTSNTELIHKVLYTYIKSVFKL